MLVLSIMPTSSALEFGRDSFGPSYGGGFGGDSFVREYRAVNSVDNSYVSPINSVTTLRSNNTYNSNYNYHYNSENVQVLRPVTANSYSDNSWKFKSYTRTNNNSYKAYTPQRRYNTQPVYYYTTPVYYYTPVNYYYSW